MYLLTMLLYEVRRFTETFHLIYAKVMKFQFISFNDSWSAQEKAHRLIQFVLVGSCPFFVQV